MVQFRMQINVLILIMCALFVVFSMDGGLLRVGERLSTISILDVWMTK